jgi:dihydroorotase
MEALPHIRWPRARAATGGTMSDDAGFDLILRGGRVICPVSGLDGVRDVGVSG